MLVSLDGHPSGGRRIGPNLNFLELVFSSNQELIFEEILCSIYNTNANAKCRTIRKKIRCIFSGEFQ